MDDAHYSIPVIDADFDTLWNRELYPYRVLIEAGPAVAATRAVISCYRSSL